MGFLNNKITDNILSIIKAYILLIIVIVESFLEISGLTVKIPLYISLVFKSAQERVKIASGFCYGTKYQRNATVLC